MLRLRYETPSGWIEAVNRDLVAFLQDHAANERKVAHSALTLVAQHPGRTELVAELIEVAREELDHFKLIHDLLVARGAALGRDAPDPYMGKLRRASKSPDARAYLRDRLLLFAIVEARGCERFRICAEGLEEPELRATYHALAQSEARHHALYLRLARLYFGDASLDARLDELLDLEAEVARGLPLRATLH